MRHMWHDNARSHMHCLYAEEVKDLLKKGVDRLKEAGFPDSLLDIVDDAELDSLAELAVSQDNGPIEDISDAVGAIMDVLLDQYI